VSVHPHRPLVRTALLDATGTQAPSRAQVVVAFNSLCDRLGAVLEPLFGRRAVDALFTRARHLASQDFPPLASALGPHEHRCRLDAFDERGASAADAAEMLAALLAYKIELLTTLVGEDLVMPLIRRAWPAAARNVTNDETK
jgi:hypothetical protein